jgi:hypothetical protein
MMQGYVNQIKSIDGDANVARVSLASRCGSRWIGDDRGVAECQFVIEHQAQAIAVGLKW